MKRVAIAFFGPKGCGKSTAAEVLTGLTNWPVIRTGEFLRRLTRHRTGTSGPEQVRQVADGLRMSGVPVMEYVLSDLGERGGGLPACVIVDSVREDSDIVTLRRHGYQVILVRVMAPEEPRTTRVAKRTRDDDPRNAEEMRKHDRWEQALAGPSTRKCRQSLLLKNDGAIEDLARRLEMMVRERALL
jgi:dephospho-CoA kinase